MSWENEKNNISVINYVLLHELHERNRMAEGLPYSKAHAESIKLEYHSRHHPDELHDALITEGWA
jgi:hypothetical protein